MKVKTTRSFISPIFGHVDAGVDLEVSRSMGQSMIDVGAAVKVEEYETKVIVQRPLDPPSPSSAPAPAPTVTTPKKPRKNRKLSQSTTQ